GREIAFEHAAIGAEQVYAGLDVGLPHRGKLRGCRWSRHLAIVIGTAAHHHAPELYRDVRTTGEFGHGRLPLDEDVVPAAGIAPEAERRAAMADDDRRLRKGARKIDEIRQLGMIDPGVE